MRRLRSPLREDSEVFDPLDDTCPKCGGPVHKLMSSPAIQFKGSGFYITDYAQEGSRRGGRRRDSASGERRPRAKRGEVGEVRRSPEKSDSSAKSDKSASSRRRSGSATDRRRASSSKSSAKARTSKPSAPKAEYGVDRRLHGFPTGRLQIERRQIRRELVGEIRPAQREIHHGFQESELVAGVVADAFDLARVDRPRLQQLAQAVGQLDLAGAIALGGGRAPGRCPASGRSGR